MGCTPPRELLQQAAEWFALLRSNDATQQDYNNWRLWMGQSPGHQAAWRRVEEISQRFAPLQPTPYGGPALSALQSVRHQRRSRRQVLGDMAMLAGGALLGWTAWRHPPATMLAWMADYRSGTGEIRPIELTDGTQLWLGTNSAINVDYSVGQRLITVVTGELLIETAPDSGSPGSAGRPFMVQTPHGTMRALGTRFNVRLADTATELAVFEGSVEIRQAHDVEGGIVQAGQQTRFDGHHLLAPPSTANPARQAWARGILLAEDMPLSELVHELSRYYRGYIDLAPEVADLRVLGGYPLGDVDQTLKMLQAMLPIQVRQTLPRWISIREK